MIINNGSYKKIFVDAKMEQFLINSGTFERLDLTGDGSGGCNTIHISFYGVKGTINIQGVKCKSISFVDVMGKDTDLSISNSSCAELKINRYVNDGRLKLFNVDITDDNDAGKAIIHQSNLSKAEFYNINYGKHALVDIVESFIAEVNFIKVNWPKSLKKASKKLRYEDMLDRTMLYMQLKSAYNKQGDTILEHDFHALEMYTRLCLARKALFASIEENAHPTRTGNSKSRLMIFQDWVVLSLSHISSKFGMDWIRPLLFALVVNIPLFTWMVAMGSVKNIVYDPSIKGIIASFNYFPEYLYYLYPLRKIEYDSVNISVMADLLMRSVTGYCIYNFVRATRRFVK